MMQHQRATSLKRMQELLNQTEQTYIAYLNSGGLFLHARILRQCNANLRTSVVASIPVLPKEYLAHALMLIHHIDVWTTLWEEAYRRDKPKPNSVFSFENSVNFPQEAVAKLVKFAQKNE